MKTLLLFVQYNENSDFQAFVLKIRKNKTQDNIGEKISDKIRGTYDEQIKTYADRTRAIHSHSP